MLEEIRDKLTDFEKIVFQRVYEHWRESGEWPKSLPLFVEYRKKGDIYKIAKEFGYQFLNAGNPYERTSECRIGILGIALCEGSDELIEKIFDSVQVGVNKLIDNPEEDKITSEEIQEKGGFSDDETRRICKLLYDDHSFFSGGTHFEDGRYSLSISYHILEYENIKNIEDYLNLRKDSLPPRFGGKMEQYPVEAYYPGDVEHFSIDEFEQYSPKDVGFISDSNLRTLVERDLEELHKVLYYGAWKSATILSAIIAEALLLDLLTENEEIARRNLGKRWPDRASIFDMALVANRANLISEPEHDLFKILGVYRDQIHPNRAYSEKRPDEYTARGLFEFVQKLIKDMKERADINS